MKKRQQQKNIKEIHATFKAEQFKKTIIIQQQHSHTAGTFATFESKSFKTKTQTHKHKSPTTH